MACPKCGGKERRLISPGYFQCTTKHTRIEYHGPTGPGSLGPDLIPVTCGHRYQEGSADVTGASACECGLFAIGTCRGCGRPLCGDHARRNGGRVTCATCLNETARHAAEGAFEFYEQAMRTWTDWLAGLGEPMERFLMLRTGMPRPPREPAPGEQEAILAARENKVRALFGDPPPPYLDLGDDWRQWSARSSEVADFLFPRTPAAQFSKMRTLLGGTRDVIPLSGRFLLRDGSLANCSGQRWKVESGPRMMTLRELGVDVRIFPGPPREIYQLIRRTEGA